MKNEIQNELNEHIKSVSCLTEATNEIAEASKLCIDILNLGGKILIFGNG